MPRTLPSQIPESMYPEIRRAHEERLANIWCPTIIEESNRRKERFLEVFTSTFSVSEALRRAHVPRRLFMHWKTNDIDFVISYNNAVAMWFDSIMSSAAVRARGYLMADPSTESGYAEDALGSPIYHNADSGLTKSFLKAMDPAFNDKVELTGANEGPIQTDNTWTIKIEDSNNDEKL